MVGVTNREVPCPKVSESLPNGPCVVVASSVLDDGDVTGFSSRGAIVVGLERVVSLEDDNVICTIAG